MIFSLILGVIVGGLSVIFALQNVTTVTVNFLQWEITASLALVLIGSILCGALVTLLILLPSVIRDQMYLSNLKREKRQVEDEFAKHRIAAAQTPTPVATTTTVTTDRTTVI